MTNIFVTKLLRGHGIMMHFMMFFGLVYDDLDLQKCHDKLERHKFHNEYILSQHL